MALYFSLRIEILLMHGAGGGMCHSLSNPGIHFNLFFDSSLSDKLRLIRFLVEEQGFDVNQTSRGDGYSSFWIAVQNQKNLEDDFSILEYLLSRGANINIARKSGDTLLDNMAGFWTCNRKSWHPGEAPGYVVEWLEQHGAHHSNKPF